MISEKDKEIIIEYSKKYKVSYVILFGSSTKNDRESNDIDIGVKGIEPGLFFDFYAELYKICQNLWISSTCPGNHYSASL
ncbi:MAG: hypothetical protein OIN86_09555 [Candidatus Methanoperedens sp.]|nr:hypothetical protein [Candidatus Methanoperedens sp.]CAG0980787.1 hypothetical protein METP1_01762 [Methanosarcinales archaeon]